VGGQGADEADEGGPGRDAPDRRRAFDGRRLTVLRATQLRKHRSRVWAGAPNEIIRENTREHRTLALANNDHDRKRKRTLNLK
jgi:hypothetical protein